MWSIRSFLNTDTPSLSKIWTEHYTAAASTSRCSVSLWDQCILSKIYFRPEDFLIAIDEKEQAVGMIHFGPGLSEDGLIASDGRFSTSNEGLIHLLCVSPHVDESIIAQRLVEHAVAAMQRLGLQRCFAVGSPDRSLFYFGIADGDNLMGVLGADSRTQSWLQQAGFQPITPTEGWELSLDAFRPPMDRVQISIRRSCSIGRILEESHPSWWVSTVLGHCDQSRFNLISHTTPRAEMEVLFWYPDSTMRGMDASIARLQLPPIPADDTNRERLICLIAEAVRQLQQERKRTIRVVASAQHQPTIQLLQRLGFRATSHGMVMGRELEPHGSSIP